MAAEQPEQPAATPPEQPPPKPATTPARTPARRSRSGRNSTIHGVPRYSLRTREKYMNERQQEHFRQILHAWKKELMEEVDRTMNHMQSQAANFPDASDRATQEEEFAFKLRTRDRERKLIRKIDQTLELIENDEYGWCEQCGVEIGIRRLEARPTATLCIDCKTLDEIKERQVAKRQVAN
ncbi:MAG: RNA polymerase-binding protein DksA [Cellvibrionales bacterium]|nr:RNA polymerase-binding protein DksA [Cellvibrionales bacterium]